MAINLSDDKTLSAACLNYLERALKIRLEQKRGPELGKTYALLALKRFVMNLNDSAMYSNAREAIPLLADNVEDYLYEFCAAASFSGSHNSMDPKSVSLLKDKVGYLKVIKMQLKEGQLSSERVFTRIYVDHLYEAVNDAIASIENGGIVPEN